MQLHATFDLSELKPAEIAAFEAKCRQKKVSPDKQLGALIKKHSIRAKRKKAA